MSPKVFIFLALLFGMSQSIRFAGIDFGVKRPWIDTIWGNTVWHMEKDVDPDSSAFLYADGYSLYEFTNSRSIIVGFDIGTPERGAPGNHHFFPITGFYQKDAESIIAVLSSQSCLILINRNRQSYSPFAGSCGERGFVDGAAADARFNNPWSIIEDTTSPRHLIVSDRKNHALRRVNMDTGDVTTVANSGLNQPAGLTWSLNGSSLYVANIDHISKLTFNEDALESTVRLAGWVRGTTRDSSLNGTRISYGLGIIEIKRDVLMLADPGMEQLLILDIANDRTQAICRGSYVIHPYCKLIHPASLLYSDSVLYMGDSEGVRKLAVTI